jgi:hypothetical protein
VLLFCMYVCLTVRLPIRPGEDCLSHCVHVTAEGAVGVPVGDHRVCAAHPLWHPRLPGTHRESRRRWRAPWRGHSSSRPQQGSLPTAADATLLCINIGNVRTLPCSAARRQQLTRFPAAVCFNGNDSGLFADQRRSCLVHLPFAIFRLANSRLCQHLRSMSSLTSCRTCTLSSHDLRQLECVSSYRCRCCRYGCCGP